MADNFARLKPASSLPGVAISATTKALVTNGDTVGLLSNVDWPISSLADIPEAATSGETVSVDGKRYQIAASSATDHHLVTSGGVKLYDLTPLHLARDLRQRVDYEPFAGFDDGTTDTQDFSGSRLPPQGFARIDVDGVENDFVALRDDSGGSTPERYRIVQYVAGTSAIVAKSSILDLGHVQDLSGTATGTAVTLYCQMNDGTDDGKGLSVIEWQGAGTTQSDVTEYQLFGSSGSGHRFEQYSDATIGVSGDRVELLANDTKSPDDTGHSLFVYSLAEIVAAGDPLDVDPLTGPVPVAIGSAEGQNTLQGCDVGSEETVLLRGFVNPYQRKALQFISHSGDILATVEPAFGLNEYTQAQLGEDGTLGALITMEPEGVTRDSLGRIHCVFQEEWHDIGQVVTWEGSNWTPRRASVTSAPSVSDDWVETTATATDGAWTDGNTYTWGSEYTRRAKVVVTIDKPLADATDAPLSNPKQFVAGLARIKPGASGVDIEVPSGKDFLIGYIIGALGKTRRILGYYSERTLRLFDAREGSDNITYSSVSTDRSTGRGILLVRARDALANGAGLNLYDKDDNTFAGHFRMWGTTSAGAEQEAMNYNPDLDRWDMLRNVPHVIKRSAVQVTHTGDTAETTLASITVPAAAMGANGYLEVTIQTGQTNNANAKTLRATFGGTEVLSTSVASEAASARTFKIHNRNSTTSQVTSGDTDLTTAAVDTDTTLTLAITVQLGSGGDTIGIEAYSVAVCYGA